MSSPRGLAVVHILFSLAAIVLLVGCPSSGAGNGEGSTDQSTTLDMPGIGKVRFTLLSDNGGRVAWYTGTAGHRLIAFDARTQVYDLGGGISDYRTDIFVMEPDGSGRRCLSCDIQSVNDRAAAVLAARRGDHDDNPTNDDLPGFFLGQPEWHPDGRHLIMQVENVNSRHDYTSFQSFGRDQDLWILDTVDLSAAPVLEHTQAGAAFLHPRLSRSGDTAIFSARAGGYGNIWGQSGQYWYLAVAGFNIDASPPTSMIQGIAYKAPNGNGFYETTGFLIDSDTDLSYSFTAAGGGGAVPGFVDDGYATSDPYTSGTHVAGTADDWDEKPRYSPSGQNIAIMSNRFQSDWTPTDGAAALCSELYLGPPGGALHQLTDFKSFDRYAGKKLLVSDHEWNRSGDELVVLVQPHGTGQFENGEVWLVELPQAY